MNAIRLFLLYSICCIPLLGTAQNIGSSKSASLQTIAFGSCSNQEKPQPMWQFVCQNKPQLWIWLGDNVYADTDNMPLLAQKYQKLKYHPEYTRLRKQCQIVGTWDDHDYGVNDGGKEWAAKKGSQQELLNFLDVPKDAPVRSQEGVYQSYYYGEGAQKVKVIILDTRYFRDSLTVLGSAREKYCLPNTKGDILGAAQWQWLESELTNSDAAINLLCSSIQVIPEQHNFEKWANFPRARARLFKLLIKTQTPRVIILSGDRHMAEVSRFDLEGLEYPIYEITSSGLTHTWPEKKEEPNRYRVGDMVIERNFGLIRIDWRNEIPQVIAEIRGLGNQLFLQQALDWSMD